MERSFLVACTCRYFILCVMPPQTTVVFFYGVLNMVIKIHCILLLLVGTLSCTSLKFIKSHLAVSPQAICLL